MIAATIVGNLVADATERQGHYDNPVVCFSIASRSGRKKHGETVTDFVLCEIRSKWASKVLPSLTRGARVFVTGELCSFRHTGGDMDLEVVVDRVKFLDPRDNG